MSAELGERLHAGCQALGLALDETQRIKLLDFMGLLQKWNKVYNLTAVRNTEEMLTHHLLDSLAAVAPLQRHLAAGQGGAAPRLLDVGSGGGLPGVTIAICCPEIDVTCVDAVAKKTAFIQQVSGALALPNLHARHARVETISQPHDVIVSRAFAALPDFTAWSAGALAPDGVWLAMKGKHPNDELAVLPENVNVFHVEPLQVPGLDAERCIVWMKPV